MNWRNMVVAGVISSFVFGETMEAGHNDIDKKHNHTEGYSSFQYNPTPIVMGTSGYTPNY